MTTMDGPIADVSSPLRSVELPDLVDLLDLEPLECGLFRSRGTGEPGHRLYGGETCAQALVAAERTVPAGSRPHSLHAYFLRPGDTDQHVVFRVERLQDGRTFQRRRVTAVQRGEALLSLEASFTTDHSGPSHHVPAPDAPRPEDCSSIPQSSPRGWQFGPTEVFDIRPISDTGGLTWHAPFDTWFRSFGEHTGDRVSTAALLTYFSDFGLVPTVLRRFPRTDVSRFTSLDHVLWFHNEVRFDDWLYYAKSCPAAGALRGLAEGRIFHRDGTLIATVVQEGLIHTRP